MSKTPHKDTKVWLLRWLRGDATRVDESHLDQLAQDDPFLAEAMEGYRAMAEVDFEEHITALEDKLLPQTKIFHLNWKIAAAILFLIVATAGFWLINKPNSVIESGMADQLNTKKTAAPQVAEEEIRDAVIDSTEFSKEENNELIADATTIAPKPTVVPIEKPISTKKEKIQAPIAEAEVASEEGTMMNDIAVKSVDQDEEIQATVPTAYDISTPSVERNNTQDITNHAKTLRGQVLDENNEPLIGANVMIPGTKTGAITDFNGNFNLPLENDTQELQIGYVGYNAKTTKVLPDQNDIKIVMQAPALALDEVTVTGYNSRAAKRKDSNRSMKQYKKEIESQIKSQFKSTKGALNLFITYNNELPTIKIRGKNLGLNENVIQQIIRQNPPPLTESEKSQGYLLKLKL